MSCCSPVDGCVFAKALLSRHATCACAARHAEGEQLHLTCTSPEARKHCAALAALLHERSRFALRLPSPRQPLLHAQALRLQCGGLAALQHLLGDAGTDVHHTVSRAQQRYGSLTELPWSALVTELAAWQPPRRARGR